MNRIPFIPNRRRFLGAVTLGTAAFAFPEAFFTTPGLFAEELVKTPAQTEGPFYPNKLPLDTDNDLIIVNNSITPAVGAITHLSGRILDAKGNPVRGALVEIWQVDNNAVYLHTGSDSAGKRDANFQGFGRFLTSSTGEYYFRTIKPVPYPGRTPHIHFKIKKDGREVLTTQCYVKGAAQNDRDMVLRSIKDAKAREAVLVDFAPIKDTKTGELSAKFDIVLGITPES
jgi:protocatechuate 3,4-dioxygenase, beta subunit